MTKPSLAEGWPDEPSLEEKVMALFITTKAAEITKNSNFARHGDENPHQLAVARMVGWLPARQLLSVIESGGQLDTAELILLHNVDAWSEYQTAKMLSDEAYRAYANQQNALLDEMLKDKYVTVKVRNKDKRRKAISPYDDEGTTWSDNNPTQVGGDFLNGDVATGIIMLRMEQPEVYDKYWLVNMFDRSAKDGGIHPLVDIKIDDRQPQQP